MIVVSLFYTVQYCVKYCVDPIGKTACGARQQLSGCLDGLDKDIKGKQKAALWQGHRRGQTSLFSIYKGGGGVLMSEAFVL